MAYVGSGSLRIQELCRIALPYNSRDCTSSEPRVNSFLPSPLREDSGHESGACSEPGGQFWIAQSPALAPAFQCRAALRGLAFAYSTADEHADARDVYETYVQLWPEETVKLFNEAREPSADQVQSDDLLCQFMNEAAQLLSIPEIGSGG